MKDIVKSVLSIVGPAFAVLLLGFTGFQTWSLLLAVSGSPIIAAIGLILFEVGMVYWWWVFRTDAEGLPQMALSLLVFVACLMFVVIATALKLGAVDAALLGVNTAAKIITAAAVIQLAAKLIFPLLHPDVMSLIKERVQDGKITSVANSKFDAQIDRIADEYADAMVAERTAQFLTRLNTKYSTRYQLPGSHAPVVIEAQPEPTPTASGIFDRLFGHGRKPQTQGEQMAIDEAARLYHDEPVDEAAMLAYIQRLIDAGQLSVPLSNSTYDTARHGQPAQPAAGQGQGNGPAGHRIGGDANFQ